MIYGQVLQEAMGNIKVVSGPDRNGYYHTNLVFKGVPVVLGISSSDVGDDEYIEHVAEKLKADFLLFKQNFERSTREQFATLVPLAKEWNMGDKSVEQLMKMGKLSSIIYSRYNSIYGSFTCFFNDVPYKNKEFFEGHSFSVEYSVQNGKFHISGKGQLEG